MLRLPVALNLSAGLITMMAPAMDRPTFALHAQTAAPKVTKPASNAKPAVAPADTSLFGVWRVSQGVLAPWVPATDKSWDTKRWVGRTILFDAKQVGGPESLKCNDAHYEATNFPADALFQGALKEPAKTAAQSLGIGKFPVRGTSLNCSAGLYEFHRVDANAVLVAVNNVIWTLDRSPGALAAATTPAGVVQRFLETHFAGDMGFDAASVTRKQQFLAASLIAETKKYFAKPASPNEVPDIDGDPFTNSQEYPARFSVGVPTTAGTTASVRVRFSDAYRTQDVTYLLRLGGGTWRVDDVRYASGPGLRALLSGAAK